MLAPVSGTAAAVVEHERLRHDRCGPRRRAGRSRRATRAAGQHDRAAGRARATPGRAGSARSTASAQRPQPGAPEHQLERLGVKGVEVARGGGVEDQDALVPAGRRREPLQGRQPAGRVAPGELVLGGRCTCRRRGGTPPRAGPPRSCARTSAARGSPRAGGWLLLVERGERGREASRRRGPSPRSRASEIAEETLCVSASVNRRASISASAYCR